jgi:hypothetical protein
MTHDRHVCEPHTLCCACFRSERDRQRARSFDDGLSSAAMLPRSSRPALTAAQRAHRVRMLAHLRARAAAATRGQRRGREWHCDA